MQFSAVTDSDLRRRTTRRNSPNIPLEEELSPEELIAFYARMEHYDVHKAQRERTKLFFEKQAQHSAAIEKRIEKRKSIVDRQASFGSKIPSLDTRLKMLDDEDEWEDPEAFNQAWSSFQITQVGTICEDRKQLAAWLGVDPHDMKWDTIVKSLFNFRDGKAYITPKLSKLVAACRASAFPVDAWNAAINAMEPGTLGGMQYGNGTAVVDLTRPQHEFVGMLFHPKENNALAAIEWMRQATNHELPNRITKCAYSGRTMIESGRRGDKSFWRIAPDWQGMSLAMARQAVTYAAILSGLVEGTLIGKAPDVVHQLVDNPDSWCVLAVATKHPIFYHEARFILMLRDLLYFSLDDPAMVANMKVCERIAAKAQAEDNRE